MERPHLADPVSLHLPFPQNQPIQVNPLSSGQMNEEVQMGGVTAGQIPREVLLWHSQLPAPTPLAPSSHHLSNPTTDLPPLGLDGFREMYFTRLLFGH